MADVYPNTPQSINNALDVLRAELEKQNLNQISVKAAAEYMLDSNFETLLNKGNLLTLNDENYLLIELSYFQPPINLENTIYKIINSGYKPVLAHPERYNFYHNNFDYYNKLKEMGCAFQINVLSLSNYYGNSVKKTAFKLLKNGLIDFIGTDIHHAYHTREFTNLIVSEKTLKLLKPVIDNTKENFSF
jgi:protein-tyrosine phosphatase